MTILAERIQAADLTARRARRDLEDAVLEAVLSGRSQRDIASEVGRSQPEVARLVKRAKKRHQSPSVSDTGLVVADELRSNDTDFAFRLVRTLVERLHSCDDDALHALTATAPRTGSEQLDALIAGAVAWVFGLRNTIPPAWTNVEPLKRFWMVRPEPAMAAHLLQRTPSELAVLGVWIDADSLGGR